MKDKKLYFDPEEISVKGNNLLNEVSTFNTLITEHELLGLTSLGCHIDHCDNYVLTAHPDHLDLAYYNRLMCIRLADGQSTRLIEDLKGKDHRKLSIVINPFTLPNFLENELVGINAQHKLSSIVLGKKLTACPIKLPNSKFSIKQIDTVDNCPEFYDLFSSFFLKPGETMDQGWRRMNHNLINGPHLAIYDSKKIVALSGSIVFGTVASVYAGIILEEYRFSNISDVISISMMNTLLDRKVNFAYMKSRNKGLVGFAMRYYGFQRLYNERIYEI